MEDRGVIYAVTGDKYISEAITSIRSVRNHNPTLPITLFADRRPAVSVLEDKNIQFVDISDAEFPKRPKIDCSLQTPYDQTLYLDSDTYVQGDLNDIFKYLDGFDLVCKLGKQNYEWGRANYDNKEFPEDISSREEFRERLNINTPDIMPDYNGGVFAFNMNDEIRKLFKNWKKLYREHTTIPEYDRDQPAFRKAIFETDAKVSSSLPPECNFRVRNLYESRGLTDYIERKPLIVHGGSHDIEKATKKINRRVEGRGYVIKPKTIFNILFERAWLFSKSLQLDGVSPTYQRSKNYLKRLLSQDK